MMDRIATARRVARAHVQGIRQETQYTCMAASMAACLKALGKPVSERDVNKVMGAGPMRGARWEEALATAQYFGVRGSLVVPATVAMLRDWTDRGVPVMIAWNPEGRPWSHASVVVEVDDQDTVHIMDPNCPDPGQFFRKVPISEFYKKWMEPIGDSLIVRRPALALELEINPDGMQADPLVRLAGKKERRQQKDRARAQKLKGNPPSGEGKSEMQRIDEGARRKRMIEDGTYFQQSGAGYHETGKYNRREKHKHDHTREASMNRSFQRDLDTQLAQHPHLLKELTRLKDAASASGAADADDIPTAIEMLIYDAGWEQVRIEPWLRKLAAFFHVNIRKPYNEGSRSGQRF